MGDQIFRPVALERLSSPEQLDQLLQVTSRKGWIALAALLLILLFALIWGVFGTVTTTVEGQGILIRREGVKSVISTKSGVVRNVGVHPGEDIYRDREVVKIMSLEGSDSGVESFIKSNHSGRVLEVFVVEGSTVKEGTPLLTLEPPDDQLEALIYVPLGDGPRVQTGKNVDISPSNVKWSEFGCMVGKVRSAETFASSHEGMMRKLENAELVRSLSASGPCVQVSVSLTRDSTTDSGFRWTSSRGPKLKIHSGTPCRARITVDEQRPIDLVIPKARELMGF